MSSETRRIIARATAGQLAGRAVRARPRARRRVPAGSSASRGAARSLTGLNGFLSRPGARAPRMIAVAASRPRPSPRTPVRRGSAALRHGIGQAEKAAADLRSTPSAPPRGRRSTAPRRSPTRSASSSSWPSASPRRGRWRGPKPGPAVVDRARRAARRHPRRPDRLKGDPAGDLQASAVAGHLAARSASRTCTSSPTRAIAGRGGSARRSGDIDAQHRRARSASARSPSRSRRAASPRPSDARDAPTHYRVGGRVDRGRRPGRRGDSPEAAGRRALLDPLSPQRRAGRGQVVGFRGTAPC